MDSMAKSGSTSCSQTCPAGPPGPIGQPGAKGDIGVGVPGAKGDRGEIGQPGPSGSVGSPGSSGPPGIKGDAGANGIRGPKGDRGITGVSGSKGEKGNNGVHGSPGAKGDHGLKGTKGSKGQRGDTGYSGSRGSTGEKGAKGEPGKDGLMWCNLESQNVIATKVLSTKKRVISIKPDEDKTWKQANNTCKSICGSMYFPSNRIEMNEFNAFMKNHEVWNIWLRISDEEREGHWKDPDNKEELTFTNWWFLGEPDNSRGKEHWGAMYFDGNWFDADDTFTLPYLACELT